ncbi:BolA family protein [Legionella gresilensis]|uniref:BolA family protein n=1 Tax=Legionella gresilensis TaxID=91823 RepID=UPI0010412106|nr:BolA/IbaG family iron-sulfur metabolism protein [Legionella gresilensis]
MLTNDALEEQLRNIENIHYAKVEGDGYHYQITIVSDIFKDKSPVMRQQWVYGKLKDYITSGKLHALSMKTWTKEEWEKKRG